VCNNVTVSLCVCVVGDVLCPVNKTKFITTTFELQQFLSSSCQGYVLGTEPNGSGESGVSPCSGRFKYLHQGPVGWQQRKGNPVPRVKLGHPVCRGYKYGDLAIQVVGILNMR
jgi:hypothetical protein